MNNDIAWMKQTAQFDQLLASLAQFAKILWTYYTQLKAMGFDEKQIIPLLVAFQSSMLTLSNQKPENNG